MYRSAQPDVAFIAFCCLLITTATVAADPPTIEVIDGVRHVRNGAEPLDGERTLHLEEIWRVNVEEEEELIGVVSGALAGPDGTVWLADTQLGQILVYSAEGTFVKKLCREGEGPGEVNNPDTMFWLPDGTLGIKDRRMGQFTRIDGEGVPQSSIHLRDIEGKTMASGWLQSVRCRGGVLAVSGKTFTNDEDGAPRQEKFLGVFDLEGREVARLMEAPSGFDFGARTYDERKDWFVDDGQYDADSAGRVYFAAERDRYRIHVHDNAGKLVAAIEREYEPRRRGDEELDGMASGVYMSINGEIVNLDSEFLDTDAAIDDIQILDDGRMWVKNGHGDHPEGDGVVRSFDVFDAEGRFVEVVHVAVDFDDEQDRLYHLDDGRWIIVENLASAWRAMSGGRGDDEEETGVEEDAVLEIVCLQAAK